MRKKFVLPIFILFVLLCLSACGDDIEEPRTEHIENEQNDNAEDGNENSMLFDELVIDDETNSSEEYSVENGFLYDGACFVLYETMGESDDVVYIAEREGKLCISFDDINYIPLSYSEAKEGYDAYPSDDAESHIIIQEITVNGASGIEIVSSGSYGKYYGEYIGIPDRDMRE